MSAFRLVGKEPLMTMLWLPPLLAMQSIPGTGALRTLMLLFGIVHVAWWWRRSLPSLHPLSTSKTEGWLFLTLTLWLLFQSAFIAPMPVVAMGQFAGEWTKLMLMAAIGLALARLHSNDDGRWLLVALFAASYLHVLATLGLQLVSLAKGGDLVYGHSLLGNYGYVSPFTTTAFIWLLVDGACRIWHGRPLLPWPAVVSFVMGLTALVAEMLLMAKAGQVMIVAMTLIVMAAFMWRPRAPRRDVALALAVVLAVMFAFVQSGGHRWQGSGEAVVSAWQGPVDIETLTGSDDEQARHRQLEPSFYLRMVWARIGLEGIASHPWGLGYGSDAFGRHVAERFGVTGAISSHSGWLDFALANGIAGLVLWLALSAVLIWRGGHAFWAGRLVGLMLALLMLHHVGRALIDGILFGSRFTGFALVAGALWAMSVGKQNAPRPD
jgi:hypothetical protein